ncbi:glycosyltransferase family 4 protein [Methylobacterium thuringiense]|uniref:D-inositol-3-phosphate glycosyltransferase n=1 Tax=Methylobacterium thuringiense TaxID=1003091 RepID=A0ABQ4TET9_9HYPH|nr:glycosyltransferase family 4 protein [Methylobacterium thuringiense]GJE53821.1 D-inositol-3-phosphate glycosyltransferase [Methylobacterium thuringiense]
MIAVAERIEAPIVPSALPSGGRLLSINNYYYRRGGAEVVFLEQNRLFEEIGWDVVPFAMRHPRNLPSPHERHFVEEIEFGHAYGPMTRLKHAASIIYSREARARLRDILGEARPDVAHFHNIYHHLSPSFLPVLRQAGVPVVMTVHDLKLACPAYTMLRDGKVCERCRGGRIHNVVVNRCIKGSLPLSGLVMLETAVHRALGLYRDTVDAFAVPSRFYIDKLVEWGWPRERFVHVPNFVDSTALRPGTTVGEGFLYVGRLSPEKGLDTLVRAAALSAQPVTIVGTGPMEDELRALAAETGADARFLGFRTGEALHDAIRGCRAVVLPSTWYENAPISVLEAYALGRPVIGARIGGLPEMVREGETGAIVPPGDVAALAAELTRFGTLPAETLLAMGRAGRRWVETDFSRDAYRDRLLDLYASLRGGRR